MYPVCRPAFSTTPDCSNSADNGPEIHSEVTTVLNRQLPEKWFGREGPHPPSTITISDPLDFVL